MEISSPSAMALPTSSRFSPPVPSSFFVLPTILHSARFTSLVLRRPSAQIGSAGPKRSLKVFAMATDDPFDSNKFAEDTLKSIQEVWDKTEDKLALGTLGFSAFLAIWASAGILGAIDKLPLIPNLFELVGVGYSTVRNFRNFLCHLALSYCEESTTYSMVLCGESGLHIGTFYSNLTERSC